MDTDSNKFNELKDGINAVSYAIRDENIKIKINKLINESKLEEIDKNDTLKNIQATRSGSVKKGKVAPVKTGARKEIIKEIIKEKSKEESPLEKMRKAMNNIDEEIKKNDKAVEDSLIEAVNNANQSIFEISIKDDTNFHISRKSNRKKSRGDHHSGNSLKISENAPLVPSSAKGTRELYKVSTRLATVLLLLLIMLLLLLFLLLLLLLLLFEALPALLEGLIVEKPEGVPLKEDSFSGCCWIESRDLSFR